MEPLRSKQFESVFCEGDPHIVGNRRLREPQEQAYLALREHFSKSNEPALVQIPVGCGKSGLMAILPFGVSQGRVLLVAPNVTIREGLFRAVDSASPDCFWRRAAVAKAGSQGPFAAKIDGPKANLADCRHFVVTNVQQLGSANSRWATQFSADFFDMVLIDEGHHNAAKSWQRLFERFPHAKFVSLTATPFRSDGQALTGKLVYRYSFLRAMARGYIKSLSALHVAPRELSFTFKDKDKQCRLEDVLRLKEETWFSRGVALAPECNRHIVLASIARCERLRREGNGNHQIIAAACSVEHAVQITELYREAGYRAAALHSGQTKLQQEYRLKALTEHRLDAIVQVQMLGEGFDHPPLSVAAVFRPFRTLSPYIQFIGRVMRTFGTGRDEGRHGVVVSHVGLNTEQHWRDFREMDVGDQSLLAGLVSGVAQANESSTAADSIRQVSPITFSPEMLVARDVAGEWYGSQFGEAAPEDSQLPLPLLGNEEKPVAGPQQRRRQAKSELTQAVDQVVHDILREQCLQSMGWQVGAQQRFLRRFNNWTGVRVWIFTELNKILRRRPGKNKEWSLSEVQVALRHLPAVAAHINRQLNKPARRNTSWRKYDRF